MAIQERPIFANTTDLQEFNEVKAETIARAPNIAIQYAEGYLEFLRLDFAWHQESWHPDAAKARKAKISQWEDAVDQVKYRSEVDENWAPLKNLLINKALSQFGSNKWEEKMNAKNLLVLTCSLPAPYKPAIPEDDCDIPF